MKITMAIGKTILLATCMTLLPSQMLSAAENSHSQGGMHEQKKEKGKSSTAAGASATGEANQEKRNSDHHAFDKGRHKAVGLCLANSAHDPACQTDVGQLCANKTGRDLMVCMREAFDKSATDQAALSAGCKTAIINACERTVRWLPRKDAMCRDDIHNLCSNVLSQAAVTATTPGANGEVPKNKRHIAREAVRSCLIEKKDQITNAACKERVQWIQTHRGQAQTDTAGASGDGNRIPTQNSN